MQSLSKTTLAMMAMIGLAVASAGPAFAHPMQDAPGTVVRPGDGDMTCRQMADEGASLSAEMGESGPGLLGRVGGIARAGATLLMPVAGLAVAGADALTAPGKSRREAAADTRRDRWNYLNGLYAGRGCDESSAQSRTTSNPTPPVAPEASSSPPAHASAAAPANVTVAAPRPSITPAAFPN